MTFEKWMDEMKKQMAMEMFFPSRDGPVRIPEEMKDYIDEDDVEE